MVLIKNRSKLLKGIIFVFLVLLFSCEAIKTTIIDCSKCTIDEPKETSVEIKLNPDGYSSALLTVYEGNIEDSTVYVSFWTNSNTTTCTLPLNKKFSFTARYYTAGRNYYYVVNSTTVHVKYVQDQCDNPCFILYDNVVNLRLLHTK